MKNRINQFLNILLYIGIVVLCIIIFISLLGIVLSICGKCCYLSVSTSVFISATGSLLTIVALVLSIKSSNKNLEFAIKVADSVSRSLLNAITHSLTLETIEISRCLVPKERTHENKSAQTGKKNMRLLLRFYAKYWNNLQSIALEKFFLVFLTPLHKDKPLKIKLLDTAPSFLPVKTKNGDEFVYEIITNVEEQSYEDFLVVLDKKTNSKIRVEIKMALKSTYDISDEWKQTKRDNLVLQLSSFNVHKQTFIFDRIP